jgi:hypothetical protein
MMYDTLTQDFFDGQQESRRKAKGDRQGAMGKSFADL